MVRAGALRVLMLGWEYPPRIAGGLGKASQGIARALAQAGVEVLFVLPRYTQVVRTRGLHVADVATWLRQPMQAGVAVDAAQPRALRRVVLDARLRPYLAYAQPAHAAGALPAPRMDADRGEALYGADLAREVARYARLVRDLGARVEADLIHAHDWMSFPAALALAAARGWPLCVHLHSTEYDRSGAGADARIVAIEREACARAARVFAVSEYTRDVLIERYGIAADKIEVIYNAPDAPVPAPLARVPLAMARRPPWVVFLGRLALQKGPDHFLRAAAEVAPHAPHARFLVCGDGGMRAQLQQLALDLGLREHVEFRGFLGARAVTRVLGQARLLVMPSVSEPFGLVALEALGAGTPVILSRQSGVREVLSPSLQADFWDHEKLADQMLAVLRWPELAQQLVSDGRAQLAGLSWARSAQRIRRAYAEILAAQPGVRP